MLVAVPYLLIDVICRLLCFVLCFLVAVRRLLFVVVYGLFVVCRCLWLCGGV